MIIDRVIISNLFSYRGQQTFDLSPDPNTQRNIALIHGRNGYGKTSFINSIKLLFLGTSDAMLSTVQTGRKLRPRDYIQGAGNEWQGILNTEARKVEPDGDFSITLEWTERGEKASVRRFWPIHQENYSDNGLLEITFSNGQTITDQEDADAFLENILPRHLLPFFIYDGEQVQTLAEANRTRQLEQIEKILDIATVDLLDEYIGKNISNWRREGSARIEQAELDKLHGELQSTLASHDALQAEARLLEEQNQEYTYKIKNLESYIQSKRAFALQEDETRLTTQIDEIRKQLEQKTQQFADELTLIAPLLLVPELLQLAERSLSHSTKQIESPIGKLLSELKKQLPHKLLHEEPLPYPDLYQDQRSFFQQKLAGLLSMYEKLYAPTPTAESSDLKFKLDSVRASKLLKRLQFFLQADTERQRLGREGQSISELKRQQRTIQQKLDDVSSLDQDEQKKFQEHKAEIGKLQTMRDEILKTIGQKEDAIKHTQRMVDQKQQSVKTQEAKLRQLSSSQEKLELAQKLQTIYRDYKQDLKKRRREQIEEKVNLRFNALMTSHNLIHRIKVDENFGLSYENRHGELIGMANISSGMKQLVAQALLWALKDVSGKEVPVIIDTPLARIDRLHRINLLEQYYPALGRQIILLPTDSEIIAEDYHRLKQYIYREYRLENSQDGAHTQPIKDEAMY